MPWDGGVLSVVSGVRVGDGGGVCIDLSAAFFRKVTGLPDLPTVGVPVLMVALLPFKAGWYVVLLAMMKLRYRTAILAGLSLMNYSEFGLIVVSVGVSVGLLTQAWLVEISIAVALSFVVSALVNGRGHLMVEKIAARIKVISRMDIAEKRVPQDGRMKLKFGNKAIDFRVSTLPTLFGEKIVIRILDPSSAKLGIEALGYEKIEKDRLLKAIARPYGMVLVTGPTGSGKTVSLYTCLNILNQPGVNIATVEDPAEINLPGINQVNVNDRAGLTFAAALKSFLRQDPDIIMVGEIRDLATAEMAVQAALTGHLVLSTLHTNDAPTAITRLIDLGVPPYLVNSTVVGVMAQRLVRTLCPTCRAPAETIPDDEWAALTKPYRASKPAVTYQAAGCLDCRMTGYRGRAGLYEVMLMTPEMRKLVNRGAGMDELREQAFRDGMKPLRASGAHKIATGLTTVEEVERVAPPV